MEEEGIRRGRLYSITHITGLQSGAKFKIRFPFHDRWWLPDPCCLHLNRGAHYLCPVGRCKGVSTRGLNNNRETMRWKSLGRSQFTSWSGLWWFGVRPTSTRM